MKPTHNNAENRLARFVIEREPGKGYHVITADGPQAEQLSPYALALLDDLGQPNPKGPEESFRWLGPIEPLGAYVGVSVRLLDDGEARYQQVWFQIPSIKTKRTSLGAITLLLMIGLAAGGGAVYGYHRHRMAEQGDVAQVGDSGQVSNPSEPLLQPVLAKLNNQLDSSVGVRSKLTEYLSRPGFAADLSASVVEEKNSITLIDNLDKSPPTIGGIKLSNLEVARLLELLRTLEEWEQKQK